MNHEHEREASRERGAELSRSLGLRGSIPARRLSEELLLSKRALRRIHEALRVAPEQEGAARWLLDNAYLCERAYAEAAAALKGAGRFRAADGRIMLLTLCEELLDCCGGEADAEHIEAFLRGFQSSCVLSEQELRLFPTLLRCAALLSISALYLRGITEEESAGALFSTLRMLSESDLAPLLERVNRTEAIFRQDPMGVYPLMDAESRAMYRSENERLAAKKHEEEYLLAEKLLQLSREATAQQERHVGWWLFERPLGEERRRPSGALYIAANVLTTLFLSLAFGFSASSLTAAALVLLPVSEMVKSTLDLLLRRFTPPRRLPRMELRGGVPRQGRTVCVLSLLLRDEKSAEEAFRRLERFFYASRDCGSNLLFALLCDLPEADSAAAEDDKELLRAAVSAAAGAEKRCGGSFFLLCRPREYDRFSNRYGAKERKRGAIMELCRLLCGEESTLRCLFGKEEALRGARFILTLDEDTRLTPGSARALIGAMLHPLNRPVTDGNGLRVIRGHGIIQPRIAVELGEGSRSDFARIFAPQGGLCTYSGCVGDLYMDRYGSGGFAGKGILDAETMLRVMTRRIPENRVLSHDALEGAFLRGALMEDVEFSDSFPASPLSYRKRQERWTRGDWQNLPWLFRRGRSLPPMERWRLFDSLRRSLLSAGTLFCLLSGLLRPVRAYILCSLLALVSLLFELLLNALRTVFLPENEARLRVLSGVLHGLSRSLTEALLRFLLLPWDAWTQLGAAGRALWRMGVTKRDLLQWQTAAESEGRGVESIPGSFASMKAASLTGAAALFFPTVAGKAAGVVWLLSPLLVRTLSRSEKREKPLSPRERAILGEYAAEIWKYFDTFCTEEDHFLPPDNYQEQPPVGTAHRSSPTNIGLGMIACLCAMDLQLCSRERALSLLGRMLDTVEALPKWHGHLYNWYDTRTLIPLSPSYVSTVDSGNLCGCLTALREGLREYGCLREAERADALCRAMDFRPLYDGERDLFFIGLTPGSGVSRSRYDLLESEERLTGYFAIASGQVPLKHWQRLGRTQVGCDGFRGAVSWSGSLFEYLMPELFLPLHRDSLLGESAAFCLYVQKKQRFGKYGVWGKSESAFFSLDSALNYRYKAHGCERLALSRGGDRERVAAPYASFLALAVQRKAALRNLLALEKQGARGSFGFWEAVDFTPERTGGEGRIVRCVMAHHLGMSLAALDNALCGGALCRRFMADPAMAAYETLLEEKVPLFGTLLKKRGVPVSPSPRVRSETILRQGEYANALSGAIQPLSNGVYSLLLTESGLSRARCGENVPYRCPRTETDGFHGFFLWADWGGERFSLLPDGDGATRWRWRFTSSEAVWEGERGKLRWSVSVSVPGDECGEQRSIRYSAPGGKALRIFAGFEPLLCREADYIAHPAYSRLGLCCEEKDGALLVRRLPRGKSGALYLCCAATEKAALSADFFRCPGRNGDLPFRENGGWQSAPTCILAFPPVTAAGTLTLSLAVGSTEKAVREAAGRILRSDSRSAMADTAARLLGMDRSAAASALSLLGALVFPSLNPHAGESGALMRRGELWQLSLSGDLPIAAVELGEEDLRRGAEQIRAHALLSACSVSYDLVFLCKDRGEYLHGQSAALEELLRRLGQEGRIGEKGGVHFLDLSAADTVKAVAAVYLPSGGETETPRRMINRNIVTVNYCKPSDEPPVCEWTERGVKLRLRGRLPERGWSHALGNEHLGAIFTESGVSALWYRNARECPVTPWGGDVLPVEGGERLEVLLNGQWRSLFARPGEDCDVEYAFGLARWEKELEGVRLSLSVYVPWEGAERVCRIESSESVLLRWILPLQLGSGEDDRLCCRISEDDNGVLWAENDRCVFPAMRFYAACSEPWQKMGSDGGAFLAGEYLLRERSASPCFAGEFLCTGEAFLRVGAGSPPAAFASGEDTAALWREKVGALTAVTGIGELDRLMSGWCQYQALCCRIYGRSSLYQSGGAVGFRDQLQDAVNLMPLGAFSCREQILRCCAHQFEEGDVQHWWHEGVSAADRGVRTRCSDDLLWLVWAVCEYTEKSGDTALLRERAGYLSAPPLREGEESRYETPELSPLYETVLDHCRRALRCVWERGCGEHGLLKMGGGDWNDGLSDMGEGAESTFLTFFYAICAERFAALLAAEGEGDAEWFLRRSREAARAGDGCWNGRFWPRGYYGDGTELEVLDAVCQAFGALTPGVDGEHASAALDAAMETLYREKERLLLLTDRPYAPDGRSPGYITSYGPGFRENGGQYTHALLFLAHALFRAHRSGEGLKLLLCASPEGRGEEFGAEPYVLCADIYAAEGCTGRAGWSWYTGSAGWFFRVVTEDMLGFRMKNGEMPSLRPALLPGWEQWIIKWKDFEGKMQEFLPFSPKNS